MTHRSDKVLFDQIERATAGGRALLCTLGRLGKAFRRDEPTRAELLLLACQPHPIYKGGRLLFDLLELEDLMLDGSPPSLVQHAQLTTALRTTVGAFGDLARALLELGQELFPETRAGDEIAPESGPSESLRESLHTNDLPELLASEYLYDLIVLGILREATAQMAVGKAATDTSGAHEADLKQSGENRNEARLSE